MVALRFRDIVEGKSVDDLARFCGVSRRTLFRLRADRRYSPSGRTRRAIAAALEVPSGMTIVYPADEVTR